MKNSMKFLGIIVLAAAGFCMLACPTDGDGVQDNGSFSLATLKTPDGVKSVYLSDISVKGSGRAAAGGDPISSLSYISSTGQNAPVLFSTPAGKKQFIFDVTNVEQLGERCIIITITGYYEVTSTGAAGSYTVGPKVPTNGIDYWNAEIISERIDSVLIDMKNNKLYDFSKFQDGGSIPRFMEGNIIYTLKSEWDNTSGTRSTVYKIDLSTAAAGSALQAVPLNNSAFLSIDNIVLPYTISNKLLVKNYSLLGGNYILDVSGTKQPQQFKYPKEVPGYTEGDNGVFYNMLENNMLGNSTLIRDLAGKPWTFITITEFTDEVAHYKYFTAEVSIDDTGQCTLNTGKKGDLALSISYSPNYMSATQLFTFNAAGVGNAYSDSYNGNGRDSYRLRSYLNNGIVITSFNGFIRLHPEVDGIKVESAEVTLPPSPLLEGKSIISSEDYLFWLENKTIKRMKLAAGSAAQDVYSNSGIIESFTSRDLLTASGRKLIFYQYAEGSATEVHTYSLDMYNPSAEPELLATNDAEVRSIVELDF